MEYRNKELLEEFHSTINSSLSQEELKDVISYPWAFLREEMESDEFNEIRFMYFGVFKPIKSKIKDGKDNIE